MNDQEKYKTLIVEDSKEFYETLVDMFNQVMPGKWYIENTWDINSTLEKLEQEKFDLIILDLNIIGSLGPPTLIAVVGKTLKKTPVVVLTGGDGYEMEKECLNIGAVGFFSKGMKLKKDSFVASLEEKILDFRQTQENVQFIGDVGRRLVNG